MNDHRIGLTDEQKAILDRKLARAEALRREADRAALEFNETVRLLAGGEPTEYRQEEGVVVPGEEAARAREHADDAR